jgi:hypothetical protein
MKPMDRRQFAQLVSATGVMLVSIQVMSCGEQSQSNAANDLGGDFSTPEKVTVYDIKMEGWSNLGSGMLGMLRAPLKAQVIADHVEVTLPYDQDPHGHKFTLTKEHLLQLRHGKRVEVNTTMALGHNHKVVIDPVARRVPNTGIEVSYNPPGEGTSEAPTEVFAAIDNANEPSLYVASPEELQENSVSYCFATKSECDTNPDLWKNLSPMTGPSGNKMYNSAEGLPLSDTKSQWDVSVKAQTKLGKSIIKRLQLMKIIP